MINPLLFKILKRFEGDEYENNLELKLQHVSDKKYLKLYKIDTNLVNYNTIRKLIYFQVMQEKIYFLI